MKTNWRDKWEVQEVQKHCQPLQKVNPEPEDRDKEEAFKER